MNNDEFNVNLPSEEEPTPFFAGESPAEGENPPQTENHQPNMEYFYSGLSPEEYAEKQDIKNSSKIAGLCFLLSAGIMLILNIGIVVATVILGIFSLENFMNEPAILQAIQIVFSILVFMLPFIIIPKCFKYRISDLIPLGKSKKGMALPLFLFGIAFCSFANIATNYAAMFFENFGIEYNVDFGDYPKGIFGFLLVMLSTVAVPALVEEFALRGVTLGILKKQGEGFAIIASSLLFGLMHRNFQQIPFAFLVGLALGYVTVKSGTLWVAAAIHAFNNGVSVILDYLGEYITVTEQNLIYTVFLAVTLILGITAVLFVKKNSEFYNFENSGTVIGEGKKIKWFIFSAPVIIYAVLCLLESCVYFFI